MKRFQGDAQWQRDFHRLIELRIQQREHVDTGRQLLEHDAVDAARDELDRADEDQEIIACLEHALWDLTNASGEFVGSGLQDGRYVPASRRRQRTGLRGGSK